MLLVVDVVVGLYIFVVVVVILGLYDVVEGNVGVGDGGGSVNGSNLIQRGRELLHCPEDKQVITRGPSKRYPVGQEISAFDRSSITH